MLGVFEAQMQLGTPSVGGRISIGSGVKDYETACSVTAFAFCISNGGSGIRSVFQKPGNKIILLTPELEKSTRLPSGEAIKRMAHTVSQLKAEGRIHSSCCVNAKNVCTAIMEMCRAEKAGVSFDPDSSIESIFADTYCSIILEVDPDTDLPKDAELIGTVTADYRFEREGQIFELAGALGSYSKRPVTQNEDGSDYLYLKGSTVPYGRVKPVVGEKVKVLMPITAYTVAAPEIKEAFTSLGAEVKTVPLDVNGVADLVRNLKKTDVLWLGDSLGSTAFMTAVLTDKRVKVELEALSERKGLIYGHGSSFEALIRCGMLDVDPRRFSFVANDGGRLNAAVNLRVCSQYSPFMKYSAVDKVYRGYVTGKRLKITCDKAYADMLAKEGRILTQYASGYNAPASDQRIDSVCSSDGLVMGQVSKTLLGSDAIQTVRSMVGYFSTYNMLEGGVPYVE